MLTPLDIQNAAFHRSFRGYNEKEVDEFLDRVVVEYEHTYRENMDLKQRLTLAKEAGPARAADADEPPVTRQVKLNLVGFPDAKPREAQRDIEAEAQEAMEEARREARREAERIVTEARDDASRVRREAEEIAALERAKLEEVRRQYKLFSAQFRAMLTSYYRMLGQTEAKLGVDVAEEVEGLFKEAAAAGLD